MRAELCVKRTIPPCFVPLDLIQRLLFIQIKDRINVPKKGIYNKYG